MIEAFMLGFLVSYRIKLLEDSGRIKDIQLVTDKMTLFYNKSYFEDVFQEDIFHTQDTGEGFALIGIFNF